MRALWCSICSHRVVATTADECQRLMDLHYIDKHPVSEAALAAVLIAEIKRRSLR